MEFQYFMTEKQFRRYFRVSKDLFNQLCSEIEHIDGVHEFKSEEYLENIINLPCTYPSNNIVLAHAHSTGGFDSG